MTRIQVKHQYMFWLVRGLCVIFADVIQGLSPEVMEDLGMPRRRDPDALPPRNALESFMNVLYHAVFSFGSGNSLFAVKAGIFTGYKTIVASGYYFS